ncbi:hypothetical protein BHM03_00026294 [Ensete ventricosum]|nr:hypothetical protein BHM03_00026294 [Ensete ventricosum]
MPPLCESTPSQLHVFPLCRRWKPALRARSRFVVGGSRRLPDAESATCAPTANAVPASSSMEATRVDVNGWNKYPLRLGYITESLSCSRSMASNALEAFSSMEDEDLDGEQPPIFLSLLKDE